MYLSMPASIQRIYHASGRECRFSGEIEHFVDRIHFLSDAATACGWRVRAGDALAGISESEQMVREVSVGPIHGRPLVMRA
jgi:hypothetical protein